MRHGLIDWREEELSQADVRARQARLQAAIRREKLDGLLIYTNHVRSAGVTWVTGFTPYWADAILLVPASGPVVFATALSKRVAGWIRANNPTAEVVNSLKPGTIIGERVKVSGGARLGVVELSRMPRGLIEEIRAVEDVALEEAGALFTAVRCGPDAAELALAARADAMARAAFAALPEEAAQVGDLTETLERSVREAGAEECYVAAASDLARDGRFARTKGGTRLGRRYAIRLSHAYNGVWIRHTESFVPGVDLEPVRDAVDALADTLDPDRPLAPQIAQAALPEGVSIVRWSVEAPLGTKPLEPVLWNGEQVSDALAYGVLTLHLDGAGGPLVFTRTFGLDPGRAENRSAA